MNNAKKITQITLETELAAADVLSIQAELRVLGEMREEFREAVRAMKGKTDDHTSICVGGMFFKLTTLDSKSYLEKKYASVLAEIEEKRAILKEKVQHLQDLEKVSHKGFNLKPLDASDQEWLTTT